MRINVEEVMAHVEALRTLDAVPFDQLQVFNNGQQVVISDEVKERWRYVGLSNTSFIRDFLVHEEPALSEYLKKG